MRPTRIRIRIHMLIRIRTDTDSTRGPMRKGRPLNGGRPFVRSRTVRAGLANGQPYTSSMKTSEPRRATTLRSAVKTAGSMSVPASRLM